MKHVSYRDFLLSLSENAYKFGIPNNGFFELTPLCNLDCKMCYVHLQDPSVKERMLTGDQWIAIMREAVKCGMLNALLTGGEALTHPDFRKIYLFLHEHGVSMSLKSNGILLNKETLAFLRKYPPRNLDISLYGCNGESYVAVTGHDVFAVVRDNVRAAIDSGLCVRLMITPSKYMQPWLDEVIRFARSFNAAEVSVSALLIDAREETGRSKDDYNISADENIAIIEKRQEMFSAELKMKEKSALPSRSIEPPPDVSAHGLYCNSGRTGFAVNWNGTMVPCLDFPPELLCAYPLRDGFDTAWRTINQGIRNYAVPQKCHTCSINTKCHYCPLLHGKHALVHECDETVCDLMHNIYDKETGK